MRLFIKFILIMSVLFVVSCSESNTENNQYPKATYLDELYKYTKTKENDFPGKLIMENEKGVLSVSSCSEYLDNLADYNVVESDENMHMQLYYLQCIAGELQKVANDAKFSLFDGELSNLVINNLDLTTFRSSLRRKLTEGTNTFNALKYDYSHSDKQVTVVSANWKYDFILLARGDYDSDGFEELMVLFIDQSLSSSYYSSDLLLLHKKKSDLLWRASESIKLINSLKGTEGLKNDQ